MIPTGAVVEAATGKKELPSRTWRIDFERGRINGMTDDLEAVRQAVFKILQTERFKYLIYSSDYGCEWRSLVGRSSAVVSMEAGRMLEEALGQDERIERLEGIETLLKGDQAEIKFTVVTRHGSFSSIWEVMT
jgi:phage baseplate assembly protein W